MTDPTLETQAPTKAGTSTKKPVTKTRKAPTTTEIEQHVTAQELSEAPVAIQDLLNETPAISEEKPEVVTSVDQMRMAIGKAQVSKRLWVEVSDEVFSHLLNGTTSPYIMMSGVKVYKAGTREDIEKEESRSAF